MEHKSIQQGMISQLKRVAMVCTCSIFATTAFGADPLASNNGLYPDEVNYSGKFNIANLAYPENSEENAWPSLETSEPLSVENASAYAERVKNHLSKTLMPLVNDYQKWDPIKAGWYDLVWSGDGSPLNGSTNPQSGREAIMNTYTGQILPKETFSKPNQPKSNVQNHAVIYYNGPAAVMLGQMWENIYRPNLSEVNFPEGSVVVKLEAVTNTAEDWSVLDGSSEWQVFRPKTSEIEEYGSKAKVEVIPVRPIQLVTRIKDYRASPETGWVYVVFVYDKDADGETAWEKFTVVGLQWGNDPELTNDPSGLPAGKSLAETWVNPNAPEFIKDTMGWGGRLAGPMDVATRHNVITPSGTRYGPDKKLRASSCQSCHSSAEFPFTANLYPSPNRTFPKDGQQFLMYEPGSEQWAKWFQNRPGTQAMSENIGGKGLDYDMALMFALSNFNAAVGNDEFVQEGFEGH